MTLGRAARGAPIGIFMLASLLSGGCFSEKSFPMRPQDLALIPPPPHNSAGPAPRAWLVYAHGKLRHLLPAERAQALLTDDLRDHRGEVVDVFEHFGINPQTLSKLLWNCTAISQTAQASGATPYVERRPPPWAGFEDIWIPVAPGVELAGRLAFAEADGGARRDADCIIILPGLLGDNGVWRTRDIALALHRSGFHVLALEQRGHGQTQARHPEVPYTWGALETGDLLAVAEWLQSQPHVQRTGLIGFCWGATHALIAAWEDGRSDDDPDAPPPRLAARQRPRSNRRHFEAGVIAYSPVLRCDVLIEMTRRDWSMCENPIYDAMQATIRDSAVRQHYAEPTRNLRQLIEFDAVRIAGGYDGIVDDGIDYVRLMPFGDKRVGRKLEAARVPVLIVQGANDPLAPAQDLAIFINALRNQNVAAVILPGGGHVGFAPYARAYFYSTMINFFDAKRGPSAVQ